MRIAVARFWHEANSFAPCVSDFWSFRTREWLRGDAVPDAYRNTATEIGGALAWAEGRADVTLHFSRCASAPPGGPVDQALMDLVKREVISYEEALRQSSNPDDFKLKFSGIDSTSDTSWSDFERGKELEGQAQTEADEAVDDDGQVKIERF